MKNPKVERKETHVPTYVTLGLADPDYVDPRTNATSPSESAVEQTKEWSEEIKL